MGYKLKYSIRYESISALYLAKSVNSRLDFNVYAVHPRSEQILGAATLKRDPNALTDLTAIRSINPGLEKKHI